LIEGTGWKAWERGREEREMGKTYLTYFRNLFFIIYILRQLFYPWGCVAAVMGAAWWVGSQHFLLHGEVEEFLTLHP
jgi:hypothetical protein